VKSAGKSENGCLCVSGIHAAMSNLRSSGQARCANCITRSLFIIYEEKTLIHDDIGDEVSADVSDLCLGWVLYWRL